METKEYTGWRHGTSKQHTPPRKSKKNKTQKRKSQNNSASLMALGGALGPVLVAGDAAAFCVAGVALGDIHLRFTW